MTQQDPILADSAALAATFYGKRGQLEGVVDRLVKCLVLSPHPQGGAEEVINQWRNVNRANRVIVLRRFNPEVANDTTILQLTLSAPGTVEEAWSTMRWRLERELDDEILEQVWGYTLVYQAVLKDGVAVDDAGLRPIVRSAIRLKGDKRGKQPILAQADVAGGRLWLTRVPLERDGVEAATIIVALGPAEGERELVRTMLLGLGAKLLMPDLIAHKGYHQRRQYRQGNIKRDYEHAAKRLHQTTIALLSDAPEAQDRRILDTLSQDYQTYLTIVPHLEALHTSLAKQLHNYQWWQKQAHAGDVLDFHHHHLNTAYQELELLVTKGHNALNAAKTAIDMVQTKLDKAKEKRQQSLQTWAGIIAVVLTTAQLVNDKVADALLNLLCFGLEGVPISPQSSDALRSLGVQGVVMIILLLAWWLIASGRKK
ncbi:MAG: hypothetical protein ACPGWR_04900 [Ardenticatenaceae bacterium]